MPIPSDIRILGFNVDLSTPLQSPAPSGNITHLASAAGGQFAVAGSVSVGTHRDTVVITAYVGGGQIVRETYNRVGAGLQPNPSGQRF